MASAIERLYKLTVDGAQAARELAKIANATDSLDKRMEASAKTIKAFGASLVAALSVGVVVHSIKSIIDAFDDLSKESQKLGVGVEDLQRLQYAASLSGVEAEQLKKAIVSVAQAMDNLDDPANKAAGALRKVGVKDGDSLVTVFSKMADGMHSLDDGMEKTGLAADAFGKKVGVNLIPMLNEGAKAFKELAAEADQFGGVVSGATAKSAEAFNDNLERLQRTSHGAVVQLTAGMLPALQAMSQSFVDSAKNGQGFNSMGEKLGRFFIEIAVLAIDASKWIQKFGLAIGAIAAVIAEPLQRKTIFAMLDEDLKNLDKEAADKIAHLRENFEKFNAAAAAGTPILDERAQAQRKLTDQLKKAEEAEKALKKAEEERRKAQAAAEKAAREKEAREKDAADALQRQLQFEEQFAKVTAENNALETEAQRIEHLRTDAKIEASKAADAYADSLEAEAATIVRLTELLHDDDEAHRQYAATQLNIIATSKLVTENLQKQTDATDVVGDSFKRFTEDAANSAGHLSKAFEQMVKTIIAGLLQILAKKYIIDLIAGLFGPTYAPNPVPTATGAAFDAGRVVPFARGGIVSRPWTFPMGLMGEAGPEAIMPLRRAADGSLGVQSQAPQLNVTIHNNAGAEVTTRQTGPHDFEVFVERARQAIATDLRTGGTLVARSLEQAYGIGRGSAAAY